MSSERTQIIFELADAYQDAEFRHRISIHRLSDSFPDYTFEDFYDVIRASYFTNFMGHLRNSNVLEVGGKNKKRLLGTIHKNQTASNETHDPMGFLIAITATEIIANIDGERFLVHPEESMPAIIMFDASDAEVEPEGVIFPGENRDQRGSI